MSSKIEDRTSGDLKEFSKRLNLGISIPTRPTSEIPIVKPEIAALRRPSDFPWFTIREQTRRAVIEHLGSENPQIQVLDPPKGISADMAIPCHSLAKSLRKNPAEIAKEVSDGLKDKLSPLIKTVESNSGYVNFELDADRFGELVLNDIEKEGEHYGAQNIGEGKVVVFDTSSPNVAKFMSVGHLRSTVIGESLARIYMTSGYTVIRDNHLGDWGTQFGMLGAAVDRWKDEVPELQGADPVQGLYKLYVKIHQEIDVQKNMQGDDKTETVLEKEGRAWFQRLENGNPEALKLLEWATEMSLKEFQGIYERLGSKFEYILGESFYVPLMPSLVSKMKQLGVATDDDKTPAVKIKFNEDEKEQLGESLIILKKDGASVYATRDLATLVCRTEWFDPAKIIYVVGGDQEFYFRQLFAGFKKLAKEKSPDLAHVSFGRITLPEGKMSTRQGRVVFLKDVLDEAKNRAKHVILSKLQDKSARPSPSAQKEMSEKEIDEIAEIVGIGAVIYSDLGQGRERNIKFDWDRALSLEGNSSPYIQYAYARTRGILRNAQEKGITINKEVKPIFSEKHEQELIKHLALFPRAIMRALEKNQPSVIAEYVLTTTDIFNKFYVEVSVLSEEDPQKRNTRLRLTQATSQVITNSLYLLGIKVSERM